MAEAVTTIVYKAADGSTHATAEAADRRDRHNLKADLTNSVLTVIDKDFDAFADSHIKKWDKLEFYEREAITEKVAELIVENFQKLMRVEGLQDFKS